jgi:hypothetical protein
LDNVAHGCNVGSLQSGSSSFHPSKKISLYLHALLVISRRTLSKNTQLGVLCQAALVVTYVPSGYTWLGGGRMGGADLPDPSRKYRAAQDASQPFFFYLGSFMYLADLIFNSHDSLALWYSNLILT